MKRSLRNAVLCKLRQLFGEPTKITNDAIRLIVWYGAKRINVIANGRPSAKSIKSQFFSFSDEYMAWIKDKSINAQYVAVYNQILPSQCKLLDIKNAIEVRDENDFINYIIKNPNYETK